MPADDARTADANAWLRRAREDLRAAAHDLTAEPPLLDDVAFHAQQAAEKALKALLTWHDKPFRKTHSIEELGEACLAIDATLKEAIDPAVPLSEYAWKHRYPGDAQSLTRDEADRAVTVARTLLDAVTSGLSAQGPSQS